MMDFYWVIMWILCAVYATFRLLEDRDQRSDGFELFVFAFCLVALPLIAFMCLVESDIRLEKLSKK